MMMSHVYTLDNYDCYHNCINDFDQDGNVMNMIMMMVWNQ